VHVQKPFRLNDLSHVRRARNPFFGRAVIHQFYIRTVFAGQGLLFLARPVLQPEILRVGDRWGRLVVCPGP
jgi:hypothetical protein